jgi:hypothetical protein
MTTIGVYLDDCVVCVPCWDGGEGDKVDEVALPDGFTCAECLGVINVV